jgi:hypothetical protein
MYKCKYCGKETKSKSGKTLHEKNCISKVVNPINNPKSNSEGTLDTSVPNNDFFIKEEYTEIHGSQIELVSPKAKLTKIDRIIRSGLPDSITIDKIKNVLKAKKYEDM